MDPILFTDEVLYLETIFFVVVAVRFAVKPEQLTIIRLCICCAREDYRRFETFAE